MFQEEPITLQQAEFPRFKPSEQFEEVLVQVALGQGFMTREQMEECIREKQVMESLGAQQTLGQICIRRGYLSEKQVEGILRSYHYRRIRKEDQALGRLAVKRLLVTPDQVRHCLKIQELAFQKGRSEIPRLVHILGDRGLLNENRAMGLLQAVHQVDRSHGCEVQEKGTASTPVEWEDDVGRKREARRLIPRASERFVVPDAYLRYRTGLLDALRNATEEQSPLIDISFTGVQFLTRRQLKMGQRLRMDVTVPAFTEILRLKGEVRWIGRAGLSDLFRVGVCFAGVDKEIAAYLEKLTEDPFLRSISRSPYRVYR
jgi:hypothetical protein